MVVAAVLLDLAAAAAVIVGSPYSSEMTLVAVGK
jgi:hypothetical protein